MTEENKKTETQNDEANVDQAEPKKKSGLIKYIIMGTAGIAFIAIIAFGTAFFLKDDPTPVVKDATGEILAAKDGDKKKSEQSEANKVSEKSDEKADDSDKAHKNDVDKKADEHKSENDSHATQNDQAELTDDHPVVKDEAFDENEYALSEAEQGAIDKIMSNLEFLDYQPEDSELPVDEQKLATEDSIEQVNWLDTEKARLKQWESDLEAREKELAKLQRIVDGKLTKIDQAESARTAQLAKLYDGMDARAVAQLLMNLDDDTVVSILPRMKNQQASAVLQLIPAKRAARLSKQMITIAEK